MEDSGIDSGDHNGDSIPKPTQNSERLLATSDSSSADSSSRSPPRAAAAPSTRQLQRKLESRLEHARRLHQEYHTTPGLIPIQRLPIPGARDHQPLVQWDTDDRLDNRLLGNCGEKTEARSPLAAILMVASSALLSEEDIVNFFPLSRKESRAHQELTDTFSIEEMSISGDEEEDLHLVPPQPVYRRFACCPFPVCVIL